jgi:adenylate kinase
LKNNPPPDDADLEQRPDDQESVIRNRIGVYLKMTADLLPHYEHKHLLSRVSGVGTLEEVTKRVLQALETPSQAKPNS